MKVGWVGLGAMGAPMATCVAQAGHNVTAFDVEAARMAIVAAEGVDTAHRVEDVADEAECVVLTVATEAQVDTVLFSEHGLSRALSPSTAVLIMATVGPVTAERCAHRLAQTGIDVVDAPISGGVQRAADGDLLVMISGSPNAIERVMPIIDAVAGTVCVVSELAGDGQRMKLVNQLLAGVHIAAAAEALAYAEVLGLDPRACWEVLRHGAGTSFMFENRGKRMLASRFGQVQSALGIFVKDMGLVTESARRSGFPTPMATSAEQIFVRAQRAGMGALDDSSVIELFRRADTDLGGR